MLSTIPVELSKIKPGDRECEAIRAAIIGELDAINLYEQLAAQSKDPLVKKVLLDIAREEKTHVGELTELLVRKDKDQKAEMLHGKKEVEELAE